MKPQRNKIIKKFLLKIYNHLMQKKITKKYFKTFDLTQKSIPKKPIKKIKLKKIVCKIRCLLV